MSNNCRIGKPIVVYPHAGTLYSNEKGRSTDSTTWVNLTTEDILSVSIYMKFKNRQRNSIRRTVRILVILG